MLPMDSQKVALPVEKVQSSVNTIISEPAPTIKTIPVPSIETDTTSSIAQPLQHYTKTSNVGMQKPNGIEAWPTPAVLAAGASAAAAAVLKNKMDNKEQKEGNSIEENDETSIDEFDNEEFSDIEELENSDLEID